MSKFSREILYSKPDQEQNNYLNDVDGDLLNQQASNFGVGNFQDGQIRDSSVVAGKYLQKGQPYQIVAEKVIIIQNYSPKKKHT